jgi:hypothetical protein
MSIDKLVKTRLFTGEHSKAEAKFVLHIIGKIVVLSVPR